MDAALKSKGESMDNRLETPEMQERIKWAKTKISELVEEPSKNEFQAIFVMAIVTPILDELGADPAVIVGGHAVELYTSGSYKTADVDLVMIRDDLARMLFDRLGFVREGRFYFVPELDIPIEIPSSDLAGSKDKIYKVNTPDGYCYVIGIEDLVLDRLRAAEYWTDERSLEWARYLMSAQFNSIDIDYMRETASQEDLKLLERLNREYTWVVEHMDSNDK
ncbi:hypothetical protein ACE3NQ_08375 [Paenibacillus terreus]|uniref:UbiD family decarboxylase n=1 Tax=Paenibacillus terreus TaxID=1387834 RepID=A0ABV5B609_9BACL